MQGSNKLKKSPVCQVPSAGKFFRAEKTSKWGDGWGEVTFWRLAQWRISEHITVNTPQKLMRGRMLN